MVENGRAQTCPLLERSVVTVKRSRPNPWSVPGLGSPGSVQLPKVPGRKCTEGGGQLSSPPLVAVRYCYARLDNAIWCKPWSRTP